MRKNINWDTRDSLSFNNNEEMNNFKMKKDRFLNKLRFIDEKELNLLKV